MKWYVLWRDPVEKTIMTAKECFASDKEATSYAGALSRRLNLSVTVAGGVVELLPPGTNPKLSDDHDRKVIHGKLFAQTQMFEEG